MKLRGWHIEGFGIHRDWRLDDLSDGLNVFYGPNEAGKSTLLAFLRGVLFGYPDGRSNEPKYPPRDGVAHGGRVTLSGPEGDLVVERYAGRGKKRLAVTLEDGRPGDVGALAERLGHADSNLYRGVFAFGLPELQKLGSLGDAGIQDHILAAGVTGAGPSAREVVEELEEAARRLFDGPKGRRKSARVRVLVQQIGALNAELYARQEEAEHYPELCELEARLYARMRALEAEVGEARRTAAQARKLVELWTEVFSPLAEAREQVAKLAPSMTARLPGDAEPRLASILDTIQRAEERLGLVRSERATVAGELEALDLDARAHAVEGRVARLQDRVALYESQCARRDELLASAADCEARLGRSLGRLFPGVDRSEAEQRLDGVQSTPLRREQQREWKQRFEASLLEQHRAEAAVRVLEEEAASARQRLAGLQREAAATSEEDAPPAATAGRGPLLLVAGASSLALVAAALLRGVELGGLPLAALLLLSGLVGAAAAARLFVGARRAAAESDRAWRETARQRERQDEELRRLCAAAASLEQRLAEPRARVEELASARASRERAFAAWRDEMGMPEPLGIDATAEFLEDARRARDLIDERERQRLESARVSDAVESFREDLAAVLADAAAPGESPPATPDDPSRLAALTELRARCARDRAARERREPLERRARELYERGSRVEAELAASRDRLASLLAEAGVEDVAGLQRSIAIASESARLEGAIDSGEAELRRRLQGTEPEEAEELRAELPRGAVERWQERAREADERGARIAAERDQVLREHQDRARDRARLEDSTEVMDLEAQRGALEAELRETVDEWRRLRLAGRLVEAGLQRFEDAHQPGVLREASLYFERVTGGRYTRIVADGKGGGFAVLDAHGGHRSPKELSQGTTEQLYLCIRLGLVAEMARSGRALPVVMDDVLVNFDDERAAAMAELLARFASEQQVLFFTCSSRTRDLLTAAAPDASLRTLGVAGD